MDTIRKLYNKTIFEFEIAYISGAIQKLKNEVEKLRNENKSFFEDDMEKLNSIIYKHK